MLVLGFIYPFGSLSFALQYLESRDKGRFDRASAEPCLYVLLRKNRL